MKSRIISGIGANAYGQAAVILIQLASLPIFLSKWSLTTYGTWLVISAIPAYLSMSDVGMVTVAGNRMTMLIGKGDMKNANITFQSAFVFLLLAVSSVGAIAVALVLLFSKVLFAVSEDVRWALVFLIFSVLVSFFGALAESIFKATCRYALGTILGTTARLVEWSCSILGLISIGSFLGVAVGGLIGRVISLVIMVIMSQRESVGLSWGVRYANIHVIRSLIKPAFGFMAFPAATALNIQGYTLIVAQIFGPATVAFFNTYRTLSRVIVQMNSIYSYALWPEFGRMFGAGNNHELKRHLGNGILLGGVLAVILSLLIYLIAPYLLKWWTNDLIEYRANYLIGFLIYAALGSMWHVPRVFLQSINQHTRLGINYLLASCFAIMLGWYLGKWLGLMSLILTLSLLEGAMLLNCLWQIKRRF